MPHAFHFLSVKYPELFFSSHEHRDSQVVIVYGQIVLESCAEFFLTQNRRTELQKPINIIGKIGIVPLTETSPISFPYSNVGQHLMHKAKVPTSQDPKARFGITMAIELVVK